jgi:predicted anti-sigma-YlaC factor YlaD
MRCKKAQELLKSDYLDGETNPGEMRNIAEHLEQCSKCRSVEKELQAQRMFFQEAKREQPPDHVWQNIRNAIIEESLDQDNQLRAGIFERLREFLWPPRPIFALASALTVVVFIAVLAGVIIQKRQLFNAGNGGESFTEYRLNDDSEVALSGLGTGIEEYFL